MGSICSDTSQDEPPAKNGNYNSIPERKSNNVSDPSNLRISGVASEDDDNPNAQFFEKLIVASANNQDYMEHLSGIDKYNMIKVTLIHGGDSQVDSQLS